MRHGVLVILLVIISFFLTGCNDMTQIEDRDFVLAMGIGLEQEDYKITYSRPDLSALTGQPVGEDEQFFVTYTGYNISDVEKEYARNFDKKLDLRHLKVIILDLSIANNEGKLEELLSYLEKKYEVSRNTLVFFTMGKADALLELDKNRSGSIGENLEQLYKNNPDYKDVHKTTIGDFINGKYQLEKTHVIPNLEVVDKGISLSGVALFSKNKYVTLVRDEEYMYLTFTVGKGKGQNITIENNQVIHMKEIKSNITYALKNRKPFIVVKVVGRGESLKTGLYVDSYRLLNKEMKGKIETICKQLIKEKKVDFLNLYRKSIYRDREMWDLYKGNLEAFIEDLTVHIITDITVD